MGAADEPHQVEITCLVLDQQSEPVARQEFSGSRNAALLLAPDAEVAADDRLYAGLCRILRELQRAEEIVAIGHRYSRHRLLLGKRHDLVDLVRAFGKRVGGA